MKDELSNSGGIDHGLEEEMGITHNMNTTSKFWPFSGLPYVQNGFAARFLPCTLLGGLLVHPSTPS